MTKTTAIFSTLSLVACMTAVASDLQFKAYLTGDEEVPIPVETNTTGEAKFEVNDELTAIEFELEIEDAERILAGPGGHIHCAPFGENGPVVVFLAAGMPVGFSGDVEIEATIDAGNIINDACGATIAELVDSFIEGQAYVNIHSEANPSGEIRGQIYPDYDGDEDDY
jgi:hypothetical protein